MPKLLFVETIEEKGKSTSIKVSRGVAIGKHKTVSAKHDDFGIAERGLATTKN